MNRIQQVLIALLVIQIVITGAVYMPRNQASQSGPLLADFKSDDITKVDIEDNQNEHSTLTKDGVEWKLVLSDDSTYPTIPDKVQGVLETLGATATNRLVTRTITSHKQLKVAEDNFFRKVTLTTSSGRKDTIFIGTSPGTGTTHLRLADKNEVYLASLDSYDFSASANGWIDTAVMDVPENSVTSMTMKNANGTYEFIRDTDGKWIMKDWGDKPFDVEKFTPLVSRLSTIRMLLPLGLIDDPAYKMDSPLAVIHFTYKKSETESPNVTLTIGAKDDEKNSYILKSSTSEYFMKVDGYYVDDYVNRKKDDFIKPEPTPTAGPSTE